MDCRWIELGRNGEKREKVVCCCCWLLSRESHIQQSRQWRRHRWDTRENIFKFISCSVFLTLFFFSFFSLPPLPPQCSLFVHESRLVEVLKQLVGGRLQAAKEVAETTFQTRTQKKMRETLRSIWIILNIEFFCVLFLLTTRLHAAAATRLRLEQNINILWRNDVEDEKNVFGFHLQLSEGNMNDIHRGGREKLCESQSKTSNVDVQIESAPVESRIELLVVVHLTTL